MRVATKTLGRARALRRKMTLPEVVLWTALRKARLGRLRFRRQHPLGPYILDFYCSSARLAIEVDGAAHERDEQAQHDAQRTAWLAKRGVRVIRFSAKDVLKDETLEYVLMAIQQACAAPSTAFGGPPPPLCGGGT
jgi:very-short-patch-repair endonuclease